MSVCMRCTTTHQCESMRAKLESLWKLLEVKESELAKLREQLESESKQANEYAVQCRANANELVKVKACLEMAETALMRIKNGSVTCRVEAIEYFAEKENEAGL